MSYRENTYGQYQWDVYWFDLNLQGDIVAVYNKSCVKLVSYSYDPWGKCTATYSNGGASTSATKNNLRYRGYYLDSDLGLYYLQSRYYDPNTYRFINADGYLSTGQGILGHNMYAYCNNNPVNYVDYYGNWCAKICFDWSYSSDTERVIGGSGGGGIAIGLGLSWLISALNKENSNCKSIPLPETKSNVNKDDQVIYIYRYGGASSKNLTPHREKDIYSGLSFSTVPKKGAAVTTIEAINATGILYAVQDGETHVSVKPVGASVKEWMDAGYDSVWTKALQSVIIGWE